MFFSIQRASRSHAKTGFFGCSEVRFSLVFFILFVKTQENDMSGSMFSHVFIDIFTPE